MPEIAVSADNLVKIYPGRSRRTSVRALDGLSFQVPQGRVFAMLGPNGAGKSTATKILTTLSRPTGGAATVAGHDVARSADAVRAAIGYVSQGASTDPVLTAAQNLTIAGRLRGLSATDTKARSARLLSEFGLTGAARRQVATFSGGMRRKLDVAMALVHRPQVLFLDEPTTGLDPESRATMWAEIRRLSEHDALTVVLTTHYMEEADQLADELLLINAGKAVIQGTPAELKAALHSGTVRAGDVRADLLEPTEPASLNDVYLHFVGQASNIAAQTEKGHAA